MTQSGGIRDVLAGLGEGAPLDTVLASLTQLNELLLRSGGGGGASSLRLSTVVPLVTRLLLGDMHEASSTEVRACGRRLACLSLSRVPCCCRRRLCSLLVGRDVLYPPNSA